jgi:putative two-component system response regulator
MADDALYVPGSIAPAMDCVELKERDEPDGWRCSEPAGEPPMQVVIIDDSPVMLTLLKNLVATLPHCEAVEFTSALQALAWCAVHDPDLVIVDYLMPDLNGLQFATQFRSLPDKALTPLLMLTASADRELRYFALQLGINDFLNKPFERVELQARARNMLALRASQKKLASRALLLADEVARATREIAARERETLMCIGRAAEHRDTETHEHVMRMSQYTELMARRLGLDARECELLLLASPLHDIGKIGIPDHILLKPGTLTPEEFDVMRQHTVIGERILAHSVSPVLRAGAQIAISHHEKFDGSGYPHGLAGRAIPLYGRIVAVSDVFDALTSDRPYKRAWDIERARDLITRGRGTHFDPECVAAFLEVFDEVLRVKARYRDRPARTQDMPPARERIGVNDMPAERSDPS